MSNSEEPVPWLSGEEAVAWVNLIAALMTVPAAIDAQLKRDSGINFFEYSVLSGLSRTPEGRLQMSSLAVMAGGSLSRLSHAVGRLEQHGWVRRATSVGETRCTEAFLTAEGQAKLEAAAPGHVREARRLVFDGLTAAQVRQLQRICRQLVDAASPETGAFLDKEISGGLDKEISGGLDKEISGSRQASDCREAGDCRQAAESAAPWPSE